VRLGIEHQECNNGRGDCKDSSKNYNDNGPHWEQWVDVDGSLLSSVTEVVVSGAHVEECSGNIHLHQTTIVVGGSGIELHAVLRIGVNSVCIIGVSGHELLIGEAVDLIQHGHSESESLILEQRSVGADPSVGGGSVRSESLDLDHIVSVSSVDSFSGISSWIGITSGPLEVDVISDSSFKNFRSEVVFGGGIGLHNISSLSSNVQVEDSCNIRYSAGSLLDGEDVCSVLEGSSVLSGIKSELVRGTILRYDGVVLDRGVSCIGGPVNESGIGSVSVGSQIVCGDVVSDSQHAIAVIVGNASEVVRGHGEGPVVAVELGGIHSVSKVIVSAPGGKDTVRGRNSKAGYRDP
jgi:hypothetical protein